MKRVLVLILAAVMLLTLDACGETAEHNTPQNEPSYIPQTESAQQSAGDTSTESKSSEDESAMINISLTVGGSAFSAKLYDNDATRVFLQGFPMTLNMTELNGNEKYIYLSDSLPTDSQRVGSVNAGDLMLYGSDCLVLFYESFTTSYNYTKLGYIENVSRLADALGHGSVQVTFAISE